MTRAAGGAGAARGSDPADLARRWQAAWPEALAAWGRPTRMHPPRLHVTAQGEPSFAWFSTTDVEVEIDLVDVARRGLADHAVAVLAHEVGHHVLAPGDLLTSARIAARVQAGLVDRDAMVGPVANLWCDLLINDRLQRRAQVDMVGVWRRLGRADGADPVMQLVLRACEVLWGVPRGTLAVPPEQAVEDLALLAARLVRAYARDPVGGAAGFATLLRTGLPDDALGPAHETALRAATCGQHEGDAVPAGLATDPSLTAPVVHPALDPRVVGAVPAPPTSSADAPGQTLSPGDLRVVLAALGSSLGPRAVAAAWYREQARAHLVPFPRRRLPASSDELMGGLEPWDVGDDLADVDWIGTVAASPVVVPGVTTVRRARHVDPARDRVRQPLDLDLYLDSSGSMPDPAARRAPIALAGAVLALSALRAGARVQATTWSGPGQVAGTGGFTRDADRVLDAIVAHFGGSTSFPVALLVRTHLGDEQPGGRPVATRATHVAVISDDGVVSILPRGGSGAGAWAGSPAQEAVAAAGGGATFVLQGTPSSVESLRPRFPGVAVHAVQSEDDLVAFARAFARRLWHEEMVDDG